MSDEPLEIDGFNLERLKTLFEHEPGRLAYISALERTGGNKSAASVLVGKHPSNSTRDWNSIKNAARRRNYDPECGSHHAVSPTQSLTGTSTYYPAAEGRPAQWVKTKVSDRANQEALEVLLDEIRSAVAPVELTPAREVGTAPDLLNTYVLTDFHLGMLAWGEETGEDWDLDIAERALLGYIDRAIELAPDAEAACFAQLGDFAHYDSLDSVTPSSGHLLDADSRFQKMIRVMIRCIRYAVRRLLEKHERVILLFCEGNHDLAVSAMAREMFAAMYDREPRLEVDRSPRPYCCHTWGDVLLGFHHGHKRGVGELDRVFASMFAREWGETRYRYCHTGHKHHNHLKESHGMTIEQHQTLAAKDAYAARGAWLSNRSAKVITYHKQHGEVARVVLTPEMVL